MAELSRSKRWQLVKVYYPARRFAGTGAERRAQFRGPRGGLFDVRFVPVRSRGGRS